MRRAMPDRARLYAALSALRSADDPAAATLGWAWRDVSDWLDTRRRLPEREHDDVRQRTLLKVLRGVGQMEADSEGQADGWLKRVWQSARLEHHRSRGDRLVDAALRTTPREEDVGWLDRRVSAPADHDEDEARLAAVLARALDRVHAWLVAHVDRAAKREGDYRRAQLALMVNVLGLTVEELRERASVDPATSTAAIYKWVERGREQVLLPALSTWEDPAAGPLTEVLVGARRSDAGKARPARRAAPPGPAVSPRPAAASKSRKAKASPRPARGTGGRRRGSTEEKDR